MEALEAREAEQAIRNEETIRNLFAMLELSENVPLSSPSQPPPSSSHLVVLQRKKDSEQIVVPASSIKITICGCGLENCNGDFYVSNESWRNGRPVFK